MSRSPSRAIPRLPAYPDTRSLVAAVSTPIMIGQQDLDRGTNF
jgi:hypothetical protein